MNDISPQTFRAQKKHLKIDSYARLLLSLAEVFKGPFFVFFAEGGGGGGSRCSYLNLEGWLTDFSPRSLGVFHFTTLGKNRGGGGGGRGEVWYAGYTPRL